MDYLKRMSDTGVIDFDEVDDRIDEMKEKRTEDDSSDPITIDNPREPSTEEQAEKEDGQSRNKAHDLTKRVNDALSKVQETHNRELSRLEKRHDHLKEHLKELKAEIQNLQDSHEKTQSQVKRLSDPPAQAPQNHQTQQPNQGHPQQNNQQAQPQSQPERNNQPAQQNTEQQDQPQSRGQPKSKGKADPKTSDYDSDDVALNKVFDTEKTL